MGLSLVSLGILALYGLVVAFQTYFEFGNAEERIFVWSFAWNSLTH